MTETPGAPAIIDPSAQDVDGKLLSDLRGRWVGEGINTLWVPSLDPPPGQTSASTYRPPGQPAKQPPQFISSRTTETLVIGDVLGSVPNKGAKEAFGELAAPYEQHVYDENGNLIHVENGFWLVTPPTQQPQAPTSVAKLSSIPHGTVVIVQGQLPTRHAGDVQIPAPAIAPATPSSTPPGLVTPVGPLAQEFIDNVASYIQDRIAADHTGLLWELDLASTGVANIDFLNPTNAQVTSVKSTVWIGNLGIRTDGNGEQTASVLAYVQTAYLTFEGIDWPHVSVGYLTRDMDSRRVAGAGAGDRPDQHQ